MMQSSRRTQLHPWFRFQMIRGIGLHLKYESLGGSTLCIHIQRQSENARKWCASTCLDTLSVSARSLGPADHVGCCRRRMGHKEDMWRPVYVLYANAATPSPGPKAVRDGLAYRTFAHHYLLDIRPGPITDFGHLDLVHHVCHAEDLYSRFHTSLFFKNSASDKTRAPACWKIFAITNFLYWESILHYFPKLCSIQYSVYSNIYVTCSLLSWKDCP